MPPANARIQRDASLYFVGKAGAALGVVMAIPLTTRGLGATAFADFALWSAAALWSATACVGWLQTGIGRLHRERRGSPRFPGYLASVRLAVRFGAVAAGVLVAVLGMALSELSLGSILGFACLAAATALFMGRQALAQADLEARRVAKSDLVRGAVLPVSLGVFAVVGGLGVATAALAHAFALAAAVVISRTPGARVGSPDWAELRSLARYGVPIGLWSVVCLASSQLGRAALELAEDPVSLAVYAGLQDVIVKGGTLLLMPVVSAVHAHVMALWADGDRISIRNGLRRAFAIQAVIGGALVLGTLAGAPVLARILFGAELPPVGTTIPVAVLLATGVVAANMGLLAHKGLEIGHATGTMVGLAIASLLLNVGICGLLVPHYGAIAAALGFAVSQVAYAVAAQLCSRRRMAQLG